MSNVEQGHAAAKKTEMDLKYLAPDGKWVRSPTAAVGKVDAALKGGGRVGFARPARAAGVVEVDSLRVGPAEPPARATLARVAHKLPVHCRFVARRPTL